MAFDPVEAPPASVLFKRQIIDALESVDVLDGITPADGTVIVGDGSNWVGESGATLRTSIGVGTGDTPLFSGLQLWKV